MRCAERDALWSAQSRGCQQARELLLLTLLREAREGCDKDAGHEYASNQVMFEWSLEVRVRAWRQAITEMRCVPYLMESAQVLIEQAPAS